MPQKRILVSWIGHTDVIAMSNNLEEAARERVLEAIGRRDARSEATGPIQTLLDKEVFDEVHLLSNDPKWLSDLFAVQFGKGITVHRIELTDPTDYARVFEASERVLAEIASRSAKAGYDLFILLSPGTPAMAATWVLLGKSRYPAAFFQTHRGRISVTEIPFDLSVDYVPQLLRDPDRTLQHLATKSPSEVEGFERVVGESQAIRFAVGRAQKAALRDVPVLILGESGTGKELFARAIHDASHRRAKPFIAINCAAIPRELLESELFGHAKGSFTGADTQRTGAFEEANGGTLFLDEVGECDPAMQAKLLRVLQPPAEQGPCYRVFRRVGESRDRTSDVRIVAATNRDLLTEVETRRFREDLYYRLAVITLKLPPLRERKTDIPKIAQALLEQINRDFAKQEPGYEYKKISPSTISILQRQPWPGNIRQLYNALVQAAVLTGDSVIRPGDVTASIAEVPGTASDPVWSRTLGDGFELEEHLKSIQRQFLQRAMIESNGVKTRAAKLLGYGNYQTLDAQLKRLEVTLPQMDDGR